MDSAPPPPSKNLLRFHRRRKLRLNETQIPVLTEESKRCLRNLSSYRAPKPRLQFPRSRMAAVLVALFVGRKGDLYVLLSRRSASLRTYAGDTSLPGGKVDPGDVSLEDTARREAFEEIGLPRDRKKVPLLCVLEPFLAAELIVTPVVVLILDNTLEVRLLHPHLHHHLLPHNTDTSTLFYIHPTAYPQHSRSRKPLLPPPRLLPLHNPALPIRARIRGSTLPPVVRCRSHRSILE
ncbi:NUDIX hydrolase, variant 3 [Coprinopsis cinerea AmutBmut pab1-1]|nr:NUDIX hydrolase, variant 3 [Coprinopsis cinerea AmutBmut pab1-1]